jgi:hypothetical protein
MIIKIFMLEIIIFMMSVNGQEIDGVYRLVKNIQNILRSKWLNQKVKTDILNPVEDI